MLPKQITDLVESAMKAYDLERPPVIEFRKVHTKAAEWAVKNRVGFGGGMALNGIADGMRDYLRERAVFVRDKLQQVLTSTKILFYKEMSADMKSYLAEYMNPRLRQAESDFENIRQGTTAPTGFTTEFRQRLDAILPKLNAELDLFCAEYAMKEKERNQQGNGGIRIDSIGTFNGALANQISHSQVTVYDNRSIPEQVSAIRLLENALEAEITRRKPTGQALVKADEAQKALRKTREELEDEDKPDPTRIHKYLEQAKYGIKAFGLSYEIIDAGKKLAQLFGLGDWLGE